MKKACILLSSVFLFSLSTAQAESSDEKLVESYKQNFMNSCLQSGKDEKQQTSCKCVLDSVLKNFSPAELKNEAEISKFIENVALINCEGQ